MKTFTATIAGRYLSMSVEEGHAVRIYDTRFLKVGETIKQPEGAFILLVVAEPESAPEPVKHEQLYSLCACGRC